MRFSRVVIDTNVVVAGAIARISNPARAIDLAVQSTEILIASQLAAELELVFLRPKFDRYRHLNSRHEYLASFLGAATVVAILHIVTDCRDPKDYIILELALSGKADLIITGDSDLLSLNPWRGTPILSPTDYLAQTS